MKWFCRASQLNIITDMPEHPCTVAWKDSTGDLRTSNSKKCGDRTLWSVSKRGGYVTWEGFLGFIGEHGRRTLHHHTKETP